MTRRDAGRGRRTPPGAASGDHASGVGLPAAAVGAGGARLRADRAAGGRAGAAGRLAADAGAAAQRVGAGRAAAVAGAPRRSRRCCASCSAARWPWCWPGAGCAGCRLLRSVVLLPLVLPPVVGGLALLFLLGRTGLLGRAARPVVRHHHPVHHRGGGAGPDVRRAAVPGGQPGGGAAHRRAALRGGRGHPRRVARRSRSAGSRCRWCCPGCCPGAVLAFARCLGEFGATIAFAGSLQGTTRTLPLLVYLEREADVDAAVALSLLLVVVAVRGDRGGPAARRRRTADDPRPGRATCWSGAAGVHPGRRRWPPSRVRCWPCSARTGPASRPCSGCWPGCCGPTTGTSGSATATVTGPGVHVPPHRRGVGLLAQQALLFPHLTALAQRGVRPARARRPAGRGRGSGPASCSPRSTPPSWPTGGPAQLSGGQQQRVALARALAPEPGPAAARRAAGRAGRGRHPGHALAAAPGRSATPSRPRCWSPTPRWTRWCWPTGWWC